THPRLRKNQAASTYSAKNPHKTSSPSTDPFVLFFPDSYPLEHRLNAVNKNWITCAVFDDGFNNSGLLTGPSLYTQFINRFIGFFKLLQVTGLQRICRVFSDYPQTTNNSDL
ncbi:MAG: hypothetical protein ABFS03_13840, partial [Chloroflexota bacterium]